MCYPLNFALLRKEKYWTKVSIQNRFQIEHRLPKPVPVLPICARGLKLCVWALFKMPTHMINFIEPL